MKKKYVKPELLYEQYALSQHMASSCTLEFQGFGTPEQCRAVGNQFLSGVTLFVEMAICGGDLVTQENYCYYPSVNTIDTLGTYGSGA